MRTKRLNFVRPTSALPIGVCFHVLDTYRLGCRTRIYYPFSFHLAHFRQGANTEGVSSSRGACVALEDDDAEIITLFLWCRKQPDPPRLNVRPSAKCESVIGAYLRKLVREGTVPRGREEARTILDGKVDGNATIES